MAKKLTVIDKSVYLFPKDFLNIKYRKDIGYHVHRWASVKGGMPLCLCGATLTEYCKENKFGEYGKKFNSNWYME